MTPAVTRNEALASLIGSLPTRNTSRALVLLASFRRPDTHEQKKQYSYGYTSKTKQCARAMRACYGYFKQQ